jgi:hypothetical protein
MPANTGSPYGRPNSAPPYYLGRPASLWITLLSITADRGPRARAGRRTPGSALDG